MPFGSSEESRLRRKIDREYGEISAGWQTAYANNPYMFYEKTHEIASIRLLYRNLVGCEDEYPLDDTQALASLSHPLERLAQAYEKYDRENFDSCVRKYFALTSDEPVLPFGNHTDLMRRLNETLDGEYRVFCDDRREYDFGKSIRDAIHGDTVDRLYDALRYHKDRFDAVDLDTLACIGHPLEKASAWITADRTIGADETDMLEKVIPDLFSGLHEDNESTETQYAGLVMS